MSMSDNIDVYKEFEEWYTEDTAGDPDFALTTAQHWLAIADSKGLLDDMLTLKKRGMSMREWVSIKLYAQGNPFPDVRRKGGDHDRGFSPALNKEMRDRHHHNEEDSES